jgi:hypothetical protein
MKRCVWLLFFACASADMPGDEVLGTFGLLSVPIETECQLAEATTGAFEFAAAYSRSSATQAVFLSIRGNVHSAVFDGQVVTTKISAVRSFAACPACASTLQEDMELALLSESQSRAAGNVCPPRIPAQIPAPNGVDIFAPGPGPFAFDALLACGNLTLSVSARDAQGSACEPCNSCRIRYQVTGSRR